MAKLWRAKSKMLLVSAVLISLSGLASTIEEHKCYWCGPLADQVHRSRRSQPCNSSHYEETTCDPGYDYCAVIATAHPLTESRVCVKVYQDECYSVYCNSSRHWRVVCPCRGELCNGPPGEREIDAFNTLFQKTKRSTGNEMKVRTKRTLIASSNFISARRPKIENITAAETSTTNNIVNQATNEDTTQTDQHDKNMADNDVQSTGFSDGITNITASNAITNPITEVTIENDVTEIETTLQNMETKVSAMTTVNDEVTHEEDSTVVNNVKSSKDVLTAEALQQSATPDKLSTEIMTTSQPTTSTTQGIPIDILTTKEPNKNNTAPIFYNQLFTSIVGIILQHYL